VTETVTEENIQYAPWGGDNVKTVVLTHEQYYNSGEDYEALGLMNEVIAAGFEGEIHSAMDGDIY
jgi:hypothetical protein